MRKQKLLALSLVALLCLSALAPCFALAANVSKVYNLSFSGEYVKGIPAGVTPYQLIDSINDDVTIENGVEYVCTGTIVKIGNTAYIAVVSGDVDGNGKVDSTDYLRIKQYCLDAAELEGAFYEAANVDGSEIVDSTDYLRIKGHFVGTFDLYADSYLPEDDSSEESSENTSGDASGDVSDDTSGDASGDVSEDTSGDVSGDTSDDVSLDGTIHFKESSADVTGAGVSVSGTTVTVTAAGEYKVTGSCGNGRIIVQAGDEDNVKLRLGGVSLSSLENGAIFFESAKNGHIILEEGTSNSLSDTSNYMNGAKGTIFAECDLKIKGSGSLSVTGNYKHAICSDDEIFFDGGNVTVVNAVNDAFHSNDGIYLSDGIATVKAAGSDAFDSEAGIEISGGTLNVAVTGEGIKAYTSFIMSGGTVNITSADNGIKSSDIAEITGGNINITCSGNGIKANNSLTINGGTFVINAELDCFDSTGDSTLGTVGTLTVNNGNITASSASGEGLQATYLYVKGGNIRVTNADNAYKGDLAVYVSGGVSSLTCSGNGIKSDLYVAISGGEITINSSMGDGIKASDGVTAGQGDVDITGGKLTINAKYDGVQADGNLTIDNGFDASTGTTPDADVEAESENVAAKANGGSYKISTGTKSTDSLYSDSAWVSDASGYGSGNINNGAFVTATSGNWVEVTRSGGAVVVDFKLSSSVNVQNVVLNLGKRDGSSNRGIPDTVTVYTSTNGSDFNNVFGSISGTAFALLEDYGYTATVTGNASGVRYVRIHMACSASSNYVIRIGEIEIYDGAVSSGSSVSTEYNISITTNGGSSNPVSSTDTESYKGIKGNKITIKNCNMYINASDDGIHSNGDFTMTGGKASVSSGDDGIHAEATLTISGGEVDITKSNEGIEGLNIYVNGTAFVKVKASDDGFNAAGGADGSGGWNPPSASSGSYSLNFGGDCFVYVNASGDGLDSNGNLTISGGKIFCEGPTNGGNSSMDHNGTLTISGGLLLSLGSAGMANECLANATSSTQCAFGVTANGSAGTTIAIKNSTGTVLCVFKTTKQFGHIVFSSSGLSTGGTYQILTGVSGVGENTMGYYPSNQYTGGSQLASVSQTSTIVGGSGSGGPGGGTRPPRF